MLPILTDVAKNESVLEILFILVIHIFHIKFYYLMHAPNYKYILFSNLFGTT